MAPVAIRRYLVLTVRRFTRDGERQREMENALATVTGACRGQQGRHNSRGDAADARDQAESPGMDGRDTGEGRVAGPCVNVLSGEEPGDDGHAEDKYSQQNPAYPSTGDGFDHN